LYPVAHGPRTNSDSFDVLPPLVDPAELYDTLFDNFFEAIANGDRAEVERLLGLGLDPNSSQVTVNCYPLLWPK